MAAPPPRSLLARSFNVLSADALRPTEALRAEKVAHGSAKLGLWAEPYYDIDVAGDRPAALANAMVLLSLATAGPPSSAETQPSARVSTVGRGVRGRQGAADDVEDTVEWLRLMAWAHSQGVWTAASLTRRH